MSWIWICLAFTSVPEKCGYPFAPPPCKGAIERCQQDVRPVPRRRDYERMNPRVPRRPDAEWKR